ncbi:hypothetical protein PMAYCL1PPCAC_22898, partial [Pristionchus mayeri]
MHSLQNRNEWRPGRDWPVLHNFQWCRDSRGCGRVPAKEVFPKTVHESRYEVGMIRVTIDLLRGDEVSCLESGSLVYLLQLHHGRLARGGILHSEY